MVDVGTGLGMLTLQAQTISITSRITVGPHRV
jgi:hypothetical protein